MTIEEMLDDLEAYFEAAGLADVRRRVLNGLTDDKVREMYHVTFEEDDSEEEEEEI